MDFMGDLEWDFLRQNGYVVLEGIVSKERCDAVIDGIWDFLERDRNNREDWYNIPEGVMAKTRTLELYHHQSMWDNRQDPNLYEAFADVLGTEKLWVSIDRVNMTPPRREDHLEMDNNFIHWDMDTAKLLYPTPYPVKVQGVLYLADTSGEQGGFQCVPSIYRNYTEWVQTQPDNRNPRIPDITGHEVIPIPGRAGDLVIWDSMLPHGNGSNRAETPRYAQYITMHRANNDLSSRKRYVESWQGNVRPETPGYPYRDSRNWEKNHYSGPAQLTALGRKLLGIDSWFE